MLHSLLAAELTATERAAVLRNALPLAAEEGLVLLRGQWVEVDREKLTEAMEHWKELESQSEEGLSFIDGMRLLAGIGDLELSPQVPYEMVASPTRFGPGK